MSLCELEAGELTIVSWDKESKKVVLCENVSTSVGERSQIELEGNWPFTIRDRQEATTSHTTNIQR